MMLALHIQCRNKVRVIDPSSAISSVFGSKWATFYINNRQKISIMFKTGTLDYWKLKIDNRRGLGGDKFLEVDLWPGNFNPTLRWVGGGPGPLIVKFRPSFFGL